MWHSSADVVFALLITPHPEPPNAAYIERANVVLPAPVPPAIPMTTGFVCAAIEKRQGKRRGERSVSYLYFLVFEM